VVLFVGVLALAYQAIKPAAPKIPGTPDGPLVTAPRIKLRDGRHLAYKEHGMPKDIAKYKIVFVHGFDSCRHYAVVANTLSQVLDYYCFTILLPVWNCACPDSGNANFSPVPFLIHWVLPGDYQ